MAKLGFFIRLLDFLTKEIPPGRVLGRQKRVYRVCFSGIFLLYQLERINHFFYGTRERVLGNSGRRGPRVLFAASPPSRHKTVNTPLNRRRSPTSSGRALWTVAIAYGWVRVCPLLSENNTGIFTAITLVIGSLSGRNLYTGPTRLPRRLGKVRRN